MDNYRVLLLACVASLSLVTACQEKNSGSSEMSNNTQTLENGAVQSSADGYSGTVIDTMDAASYTYVQIDSGAEKVWVAGPATRVNKGDVLMFNKNMPMKNFHSKALDRDFDVVYFVGSLGTDMKQHEQQAHNFAGQKQPLPDNIKKAENGNTIEELYQQRHQLEGKMVRVRGVVVKYTANVLNKDWIHLRDNSSSSDLTITTKDAAEMGDLVVAEGTLYLNKDYGYGYIYELILEDAKVSVE